MDGRSESPGPEKGFLLAYVDGTLDEDTRRQVEAILSADPSAAEEARSLARLQDGLRRGLKATRRPSVHELGEYLLGLLPAARARAIEAQAAADVAVADVLAELRAYLARLDLPRPAASARKTSPASLVDRVAVIAGRLAGPATVPALAAVRGSEGGPATYEAGSYQVMLETQEDPEQAGRRSLFGLLTGGEPRAAAEAASGAGPGDGEGMTAELYRADELVATEMVDELGNFIFTGVPPAVYDLLLHDNGVEIVLSDVNVG